MKSMSRFLPLLFACALQVLPARAEDDKKPDTQPGDDDVKQAIIDAIKLAEDKTYSFTGKLDVEAGGSPMLNTEMKGTHKKPYTRIVMDMMGQEMEMYTDGKSAVQMDPQTGQWKKTEGQNLGATADAEQMKKVIKSATWDKSESKVGSHVCRVAIAKVDKEEIKKLFAGGGGMGAQAKMKKSSLKFYIDKATKKVYRIKIGMTLEMDMGGGGGAMEMAVTMDQRFTYSSKIKLEIPKEVSELMKGGKDKDGDHDEDEEEEDEGSGK
ncbi:MAG: hypothetical protein HYY18_00285 [Planctomycetes bacterium]|nr:hypothetical protein [Planctomycetota bacterium]